MTVLPQLKSDLTQAAERVLAPAGEQAPKDAGGDGPAARGRVRWRSGFGSGLVVMAAVIVTVVVAGIALTAFRPGHPSRAVVGSVNGARSRQQLIGTLVVLRRPQTKADVPPGLLASLSRNRLLNTGSPDLSLIRYATTTPWGVRLYFVPLKPHRLTGFFMTKSGHHPTKKTTELLPEALEVINPHALIPYVVAPTSAALIRGGNAGGFEPAGRRVLGGGTSESRFLYVVPDGVATVKFVLPRDAQPGAAFEPVYAHPLSVSVPVHDNIAAVQIDRQFDKCCTPMIWYAPDGRELKQFGNFHTLNRAVPEPLPGPETPQSRAAERNPSTPNPVWVTPVAGTAHSPFRVHFRVLLSEAEYVTRLTGPSCPGQHLFGTTPGQTSEASNLRGHIYNSAIAINESEKTWCPGIYHLTVTLISEAFSQPFKPSAKPFGSATFTVQP
jgi:hypothetical protein